MQHVGLSGVQVPELGAWGQRHRVSPPPRPAPARVHTHTYIHSTEGCCLGPQHLDVTWDSTPLLQVSNLTPWPFPTQPIWDSMVIPVLQVTAPSAPREPGLSYPRQLVSRVPDSASQYRCQHGPWLDW